MRHTLQLSAKLSQSPWLIGELGLMALQIQLKGGFGYVDSSIDSIVLGLHIFDRGLTHPYLYELAVLAAALATVRVWSTGCAQLWLGFGLTQRRPRVARACAHHQRSWQRAPVSFLALARRQESQRQHRNQAWAYLKTDWIETA